MPMHSRDHAARSLKSIQTKEICGISTVQKCRIHLRARTTNCRKRFFFRCVAIFFSLSFAFAQPRTSDENNTLMLAQIFEKVIKNYVLPGLFTCRNESVMFPRIIPVMCEQLMPYASDIVCDACGHPTRDGTLSTIAQEYVTMQNCRMHVRTVILGKLVHLPGPPIPVFPQQFAG